MKTFFLAGRPQNHKRFCDESLVKQVNNESALYPVNAKMLKNSGLRYTYELLTVIRNKT